MDQPQTAILRNNRVTIVQDLEPKGTVLDVLYEDGVLTENDVELVTSAKTRKERVQTLLSILPTRGPVAYGSFQKALEVGQYEDLAKLLNLSDQLNEIPVQNQNITGVCKPCGKFLEWMENNRKKKNAKLKSILRYKACLFLDNIEPTDVIDQLFQDHVIDTDDIDKIKSYTTRRERCETLFKCLLDNLNDSVVSTLKVALVKKYSYIADEISQSEIESETHTQSNETAGKVAETTITTGVLLETRPKFFIDYSSDENEIHALRELDQRSASTFGETEDLSISPSDKTLNCDLGTCSREIGHSMSPNLNVNVTSEFETRDIHKGTIDEDHARSYRLLNLKSTEHIMLHRDSSLSNINCRGEIEEHNARTKLVHTETENAGKHFDSVVNVVGFKGKLENVVKRREIEERSVSTLGYVLSENSEPKAIVNQQSNGNTIAKDIEKQSENTHRKQINLNEANQLKVVNHAEIREIEERTASMISSYSDNSMSRYDKTEVKQIVETESNNLLTDNDEQTRLKHQNFDCVDSAFSERRLKVITTEGRSLQPSKYELVKHCDNNNQDSTSCLACNSLDRDRVGALETKSASSSDNDAVQKIQHRTEILPLSVTATHTERPRKRLAVAFNYLSTLINQGEFDKFKSLSVRLKKQFPTNYDLMCIIGYLQTSRDLFQTNFDAAKRNIDATMALVPTTSNPRYFTLEMFTAKTRMYITRKKLKKLQTTLDEAMMILETDPAGCTGRAAGWLYINHARNQTAQLSCLNLRKTSALGTYERLFQSAKTSFQRSMSNFKRDGGKDGPFGFGYALCRLVILLLRCGDNGLTMNILSPSADDLRSAGQYIQHLEDSDIAIPKILDMHFRLAKCDYQIRRKNNIRAHEHAEIAYDLATEMNLLEFKEHAHNRLSYLRSNTSCITSAQEMSGEEAEDILFGESTDNDYNTHSD